MSILARAYKSMSTPLRLRLLQTFGFEADTAPDRLDFEVIAAQNHADLDDALDCVAALGDEAADILLLAAIEETDFAPQALAECAGAHDRAALLWLRDRNKARRAANWWHANIRIRRADRVQSFLLPGVGPLALDSFDEDALRIILDYVITQELRGRSIRDIKISLRPAPWSDGSGQPAVQIDIISRGEKQRIPFETESLEVETQTVRYLFDIAIVLDPLRGAIHVTTDIQKSTLSLALAQAVIGHACGMGGEPQSLPPVRVHPEKLLTRPAFATPAGSPVVSMQVVELWYRDIAAPAFRRAIMTSQPGDDVYGPGSPFAAPVGLQVLRAGIRFTFQPHGGQIRRKLAFLTTPDTKSFKHFTPAEGEAAERALIQSGLIDAAAHRGQTGPLALLDRMTGPVGLADMTRELGDGWTRGLMGAGALVAGPAAATLRCPACQRDHPAERQQDGGLRVLCAEGYINVAPDADQSVVFAGDALAKWMAQGLKTDLIHPKNWCEGLWDLGDVPGEGRRPTIGLALGFGLGLPGRLAAATQRISGTPKRTTGILLTPGEAQLFSKLPLSWSIAPLTGVLSLTAAGLLIDPEAPF